MSIAHTIEIGSDGIAYATIVGDGDERVAQELVAKAEYIFEKHPDRIFDVIVDMSQSGDSDYAGIKVYQDFFRNQQLGKIAFVNLSETIKALVALAIKLKKRDVRFFKSVDEARDWILSSKGKRLE